MDVPKWIRLLNAAILATVIAMFSFTRISRSPDVLLVTFLALGVYSPYRSLGLGPLVPVRDTTGGPLRGLRGTA